VISRQFLDHRLEDEMTVNLTVYGQTDIGLVRASNEDAFVIADLTGGSLLQEQRMARFEVGQRGVLLAVSDGMGGHQAGEVASALVVESLRRAMASQRAGEPSDALLEKAAAQANREVWQAAHYPGRENMGATLTALFVHGPTAYIAEVGDSRAYLLRGGQIAQVTRDQSYVQLLVDSGAMTPLEAKRSASNNIVMQAMGLKPEVTVALGKLDLRERDCLVLCSDGLSNKMTEGELCGLILTSPRLDVACNRLIAAAKQRGGEDNITAIVAGVSGDLPPLVSGESIAETFFVLQEFQPPASG
jgi:serine/threonine protein phosphatase PrpC